MKVMLIEDNNKKFRSISSHLERNGIKSNDIIRAKNMTDFSANLKSEIGLFIIDFKLPNLDNGAALLNGREILETIIKSGKHDALLLAISSYPDEFPNLRELYEAHGCILTDFNNKKAWQSTLDHLLVQLKKRLKFDFIIFCALQEERNPYITLIDGQQVNRSGIDCYDIEINSMKGSVILLPQMGLVNAAVTVSLCIDRFKPSIIGMSGICGGFESRANIGQLFVSSMVYEYQSGKWSTDGFKQEPYQISTEHILLTELKSLLNEDNLIFKLEEGFSGRRPPETFKPKDGIFTSGSAVIADKKLLDQIELIHRKVNALDMEIYAVQRSAQLSLHNPPCICAKTVVDLCNNEKNDNLHAYGSYISAKFLIKAINNYFTQRLS